MAEVEIKQNDLHAAVWNWLFNGDNGITELAFAAASYDENGNIISNSRVVYTPETVGTSTVLKSYLGGSQSLQYNFILQQYAPISSESNKPANIAVFEIFERISVWIKQEVLADRLPAFPQGAKISKVIVNPGTVAGVDKNGVKLQMIIQINYTDNTRKKGL